MTQISNATVTAFHHINTDINNIFRSPSVLNANAQKTILTTINCKPFTGKSQTTIKVKAFADIKTTQYVSIQSSVDNFIWYGIVQGYEYLTLDCIEISLIVDGWLSCGGTDSITSISGLTKRHLCLDDEFGKYTMDDGLICPSMPLEMTEGERMFTGQGYTSDGGHVIVESTIDLLALGDTQYNDAITYEDSTGEVTVPSVPPVVQAIEPEIGLIAPTDVLQAYDCSVPAVAYYDGENAQVRAGMAKARSLGIDSAIIDQYVIPSNFANPTKQSGLITHLIAIGNDGTVPTSQDLNYMYANVKNKRVLYGNHNKYVLKSLATGDTVEASPEDLYMVGDTKPSVVFTSDVRSKGKPYFRFKHMNKNSSNWFCNCIEGLEWQRAPLKFMESSGAGIKSKLFAYNQVMEQTHFEMNKTERYFNAVQNALSNPLGILGAGVGLAGNVFMDNGITLPNGQNIFPGLRNEVFKGDRALEKSQFLVDTRIVTPQVSFPRSETLRDLLGNGVFIYRLRYSQSDIAKIDKILTMYGYADVAPLDLTDFTSGQYFNYVEAENVKITTALDVPRSIIEIAQKQVSSGIRVWSVNPSDSYYTMDNRPVTP